MLSRVGFAACRQARSTMVHQPTMIYATQRMGYLKELGLDTNSLAVRAEEQGDKKEDSLNLWQAQVDATKNALVLKTDDEIEKYVLSITKDYFRTTRKATVALDSEFTAHGLDSLDVIELIIKVEDELGYMIDAENLEKFRKPRHFVNFIKHMEGYK